MSKIRACLKAKDTAAPRQQTRGRLILAAAISSLLLPVWSAKADTLDFTATTNAFVFRSAPTVDQNEDQAITTKRLNDSNSRIGYLRFDLSPFTALPSNVTGVTLQLQLMSGPADSLQIYGLNDGAVGNDGITSETTWTNVMTWNNQPAGTVANAATGLPNANSVGLLDSALAFDGVAGVKNFSLSLATFQSFLSADTNQQITLMFLNLGNNTPTWASTTNTAGNLKPTLRLDYLSTPTGHLWDGGGADNNWSTAENWADDLPAESGQTVEFGGTTRLTPNNDLAPGSAVNGMIFNASAGSFTVSGNEIALAGNVTVLSTNAQEIDLDMALTDDREFHVVPAGQLTLKRAISGSFGLSKSGGGTLVLDAANTHSGGTTLSGGTLRIGDANALGTSGDLTVNGGTLDVNGNSLTLATLAGTGGTISNSSVIPVMLTVGAGDVSSTFGGTIQNGSATTVLTKTGTGTFRMTATNNSFTGGVTIDAGSVIVSGVGGNSALGKGNTTVNAGGTLIGAGTDAFGYTPGTNNAPATIVVNGGTITDLPTASYRLTLPNLEFTGGTLTSEPGNNGDANGQFSFNGDNTTFSLVTNAAPTTVLINAGTIAVQKPATINVAAGSTPSGVDLLVSSVLRSFNTGTAPLTKTGSGVMMLTGTNTYLGATTVSGGKFLVGDGVSGSLNGTASVSVTSGGTLGGAGSIAPGVDGNITMGAGAFLEPGALGIGTLTMATSGLGSVDVSAAASGTATSAFRFELGDPAGTSDKLFVASGALTIGAGVLEFDDFLFADAGGGAAGTYTLFDTNTPLIGLLGANLTGDLWDGLSGTLELADDGNDLVLVVVPEPSAGLALLSGAGLLLARRRTLRRS